MRSEHVGTTAPPREATFLKVCGLVVEAGFLVVGVLGFVPGVTTDHEALSAAGHESHAELFGLFQVSVLHNIVHLAFGVVGVALARSARATIGFLVFGGLAYAGVWIYGEAVDLHSDANFLPVNQADNWLHLGLAVAMTGLGIAGYRMLRGGIGGDAAM